jgi:hypothetical protein
MENFTMLNKIRNAVWAVMVSVYLLNYHAAASKAASDGVTTVKKVQADDAYSQAVESEQVASSESDTGGIGLAGVYGNAVRTYVPSSVNYVADSQEAYVASSYRSRGNSRDYTAGAYNQTSYRDAGVGDYYPTAYSAGYVAATYDLTSYRDYRDTRVGRPVSTQPYHDARRSIPAVTAVTEQNLYHTSLSDGSDNRLISGLSESYPLALYSHQVAEALPHYSGAASRA